MLQTLNVNMVPCRQRSPVHPVVQLHIPGEMQEPPFAHGGVHPANSEIVHVRAKCALINYVQ